jgi:hypothetical protein
MRWRTKQRRPSTPRSSVARGMSSGPGTHPAACASGTCRPMVVQMALQTALRHSASGSRKWLKAVERPMGSLSCSGSGSRSSGSSWKVEELDAAPIKSQAVAPRAVRLQCRLQQRAPSEQGALLSNPAGELLQQQGSLPELHTMWQLQSCRKK